MNIEPLMTCEEVAEILRKAPWTIRKMARIGRIPGARRIGGHWRFQPEKIARMTGQQLAN